MNEIIRKLKNKIIVSCQAASGEPIYENDCIPAIAQSVIEGGAGGLRLAGVKDISKIRKLTNLPIIGITKPDLLPENWKDIVYITPTLEDARNLVKAGADIVAIDGTSRIRPKENLAEILEKVHTVLKSISMVDVATLEEGIACSLLDADIISTTLSGYTSYSLDKDNGEPDYDLLKSLVKTVECPVILEGRIWTPDQVKKAFDLGAYAVVIGSAITRPQLITKRFVEILGK